MHGYLIASLLLLTTALVIDESIFSDQKRRVNSQETISANITKEVQRLDEQLSQVADRAVVDLHRLFNRMEPSESLPYFIYVDGQLAYWSTSRFVPRYGLVDGSYLYRHVNIKSGQYLIRRRVFNSTNNQLVEIFGFLPLSANIPIDKAFRSNGLNSRIFGNTDFEISDLRKPATDKDIESREGIFLFSVEGPSQMKIHYPRYETFIFIFYLIIISLFITGIFKYARIMNSQAKPWLGIITVTTGLILVRMILLRYEYPRSTLDIPIFDPAFYAASWWQPSLGDLLLNEILLLTVTIYSLRQLAKNRVVLKSPSWGSISVIILASLGALAYHIIQLDSIMDNSQWSLDISKDISIDIMKLISYLALFINGVVYFLVSQYALAACERFKRRNLIAVLFALLFVVAGAMAYLTNSVWFTALALHAFYLFAIHSLSLASHVNKASYQTFLYFFITAFILGFVHTYTLTEHIKHTEIQDKNELATELLSENDVTGEFLLQTVKQNIEQDILIQTNISSPFSPKDLIRQKVRRSYLGDYFDKYDIEVLLFSGNGRPINNDFIVDYQTLLEVYGKEEYKTGFNSLFFVKQEFPTPFTQYYLFTEIKRYDVTVGYIVIKLDRQQRLANSILPQLLVESGNGRSDLKKFDYALYRGGEIISAYGNFNYARDFTFQGQDMDQLKSVGVKQSGYRHLVIDGKTSTEYYVISSPVYPRRFVVTNFSVFFLFLVGLIILFFLINAIIYNAQRRGVSISAKIQLLLNFAFFLPLIIVSIVVLRLVNNTVQRNIEAEYLNSTESAGNNLIVPLQEFLNGQSETNLTLEKRVTEISQYSQADINLYNTSGRLIASNQSLIFENQILSPFANPNAMELLVENGASKELFDEFLGNLTYQATYYAIKSPGDNALLGIVSMPFFESEGQLKRQQTEIVSNILNSFTFIFVIFVFLSFLASRMLTYPFKFLTQKIKTTTFSQYNEPLEWSADDEIGLMVKEYNRMLINLEKSKKALALSEKESAWREMAQQVAHEIKNPLTPMKLKLQHLQRVLTTGKEDLSEDYKKPIESLLNQVETLSDIATSFSSFAKMPVPLSEKLDLADTLKKAVRLFSQDDVQIRVNVPKDPIWVEGDEKLLGRIFNNLILNAQQSVEEDSKPELEVELVLTPTKARVVVSDNGSGIPDDIKDKIFIPKFSTKEKGSGIGLAIAKRGVEHAGGSIWFESEPGKGTTFYLEFPLMD